MCANRAEVQENVGFSGAKTPQKVRLKGYICPRKVCLKGCDSALREPQIVPKLGQMEPEKVRKSANSLLRITQKEASKGLTGRKRAAISC